MKKTVFVVSMIVLMLSLGVSIIHARPDQRYDVGTRTTRDLLLSNRRAGYTVFRKFCKSCHYRGNEKALFLHTESKTMRGWNRVFYKKYPECATQGFWNTLTAEDLLNLNDYLYYNALDAYDPNDPWENNGIWLF